MATGRKTVVVGQVIDPVVWGNPLWDQSVQTFASAADRTAQFPAPLLGAVTYLEDVKQLQRYDGPSGSPSGWTPIDYRTHAELDGNNTAQPSTPTALSNWVLNAAPSWGNPVTISAANLLIAQSGLHAVSALVTFGAGITGRSYAELQVNGVRVVRGTGGDGDETAEAVIPNLLLSAGQALTVWAFHNNPAAQSVFAAVRVTRLGGSKPSATLLAGDDPSSIDLDDPGDELRADIAEQRPAL